MRFPQLTDLKVAGKRVLLRVDFDVPLTQEKGKWLVADDTRLRLALKTVRFLLGQKTKVIILAHLGRPKGERTKSLNLEPVVTSFFSLLEGRVKVELFPFVLGKKIKKRVAQMEEGEVLVLENLRFYPEEKRNEVGFAKRLASLGDFYVNEAFAVSHREHASIVGLPRFLPSAFGFNFLKEVRILTRVYKEPRRPVVVVLGGRKRSKVLAGQILLGWVDWVLVGGKLVEFDGILEFADHKKVKADLTRKGDDITLESAREFAEIIKKAGTVIWSGPMGAFENPRFLRGTRMVAEAVIASKAFSVVGGGDTEAALTKLGLADKIDYICSGGGAMLNFLAQRGTLPGIDAICNRQDARRREI
jgi:phosphoglycerate kinase